MKDGSTWQVLAGLRFLLAAIVVSGHFVWFADAGHPTQGLRPMGPFPAVLGFLFVSGYSIAHSVKLRPAGFYRRRLLRIYPLYLLAMAAAIVPFVVSGWRPIQCHHADFPPPGARNLVVNALMLQTFAGSPLSSNGVVWTLAVEVACYAAAPVLVRSRASATRWLIFVSGAAFCSLPWLGLPYFHELKFGMSLFFLAWAWLIGFAYHGQSKGVASTAIFVAVPVLLTTVNDTYNFALGHVTIAVSAALIASGPHIRVPAWTGHWLGRLGDLSYPLYLFHLPAGLIAWAAGVRNPWAILAGMVLTSLLALMLDDSIRRAMNTLGRGSPRDRQPVEVAKLANSLSSSAAPPPGHLSVTD